MIFTNKDGNTRMIFTNKDGNTYEKGCYIYGTYYIEDDDVVFEDCDFRNCKLVEMYGSYEGLQNLTFKNCIFDQAEIALHCRNSDFSTCLIINSHITDRRTIEKTSGNKFPEPMELCPKKGKFTAYKLLTLLPNTLYREFRSLYALSYGQELQDTPFIMGTLEIPDDAFRVNGYGEKCRSSEATLIDARPLFYNENENIKNAWDKLNKLFNNPNVFNALFHYKSPIYSHPIEYEIGKTVMASYFEENHFYECAGGIHFYMEEQYVTELGYQMFKCKEVIRFIPPILLDESEQHKIYYENYTDMYKERIAGILEKLIRHIETFFEINRENV